MATLDTFMEHVREIAEREQRPVEAVLETMLRQYQLAPPSGENNPREAALRALRPKLYAMARRYWHSVGDAERLALTDADLDEQFWLFDTEGIPRLKSEQGTVVIPPDGLSSMASAARRANFRSGRNDISANFDEILEELIAEEASEQDG
jgi:hypothetical protein